MSTDILVHTILITRKDQYNFFQLSIPRDVIAITGISTCIQLLDIVEVNKTGQAGMLQLQATGTSYNCYTSILTLEPADALKTDLDLTVYQAGFVFEDMLTRDGLANRGNNSMPEKILLPSCNCFYGSYRDFLGVSVQKDIKYKVSILLFTNRSQL